MIDKHGLKIHGLRSVSATTEDLGDTGKYHAIYYDVYTGQVWARYMGGDFGDGSGVVTVCKTTQHLTSQELADMIHSVLTGVCHND